MATANAKALYMQCDPNGNKNILIIQLMDVKHTKDTLTLNHQMITVNSTSHHCKSTKGWFICCKWMDSSTYWEILSNLKESNPVQDAEFAIQ